MWRLARTISILSVLLLCDLGCSPSQHNGYSLPKFAVKDRASFVIVGEELFGINSSVDLIPYKEWLILVAYNAENENCLHLFNKNGELIKSAIKIGRGPGELLFALNASFDKEQGIITFFDINIGKKTLAIDIDSLVESERFEDAILAEYRELHYPLLSRLTSKGRMDFNGVLPLGKDTGPRFVYNDVSTNDTLTYDAYPALLGDDIWDRFYLYDANTMMEMSPKGDKMAICSRWCGVLETFTIESGIDPISTSYYVEPRYLGDRNGGGMDLTDETVFAFADIFATDSLLYCGFDGESTPATNRSMWFTKVAVFDWEGTPLKEIQTDKRIEQICVDEDGRVFALISGDSGEFFLARLP